MCHLSFCKNKQKIISNRNQGLKKSNTIESRLERIVTSLLTGHVLHSIVLCASDFFINLKHTQ